jgi:transcriptional regulator NrdR family protein
MEPFEEQKLVGSIKKAMIDARLSVEDLQEQIKTLRDAVMSQIGNKEEIDVSEIRTIILSELEKNKQAAAVAWRAFDGKYKSTG